jgi:hypothetical protein
MMFLDCPAYLDQGGAVRCGLPACGCRSTWVAPSGTGSKSVVAGNQPELPGDVDEDQPPYDPTSVVFTTDASSAEVLAFYRGQCAESESVLATTPLSAPPRGMTGDTSRQMFAGSCCT